ncbi:GGDEF domain-containing protein [Amycolatopsis anabasis]|uniref:GGDEF domain-containing protein n=1 Tax=Amycolatopsis anabasis TaxID=1840409 RepID=UPI00131E52B1|nr:GGDEF domain-containing protein [Amycolatopsis anabasis]
MAILPTRTEDRVRPATRQPNRPYAHAGVRVEILPVDDLDGDSGGFHRIGRHERCASCGQPLGNRTTDRLTGVLDRWGWDDQAPEVFAGALRRGLPVALLIVDLDGFKQINDEFGHPAGDAVLRSAAEVLRAATRDTDLVGRYGGDEFLVLLPSATSSGALEVARRIRAGFAAMKVRSRIEREVTVLISGQTASIGLATYHAELRDNLDDLLLDADTALREAKRKGRDRIGMANSSLCGRMLPGYALER